jgi:hypothetical protein
VTLRIGVNLGDVVAEVDDLFGDGVNVAARLEQLCDGRWLCGHGLYGRADKRVLLGCFDALRIAQFNYRKNWQPNETTAMANGIVSAMTTLCQSI